MEAGDLNRALQYYKVGLADHFYFSISSSWAGCSMIGCITSGSLLTVFHFFFQEAVKLKPNFSDAYLNMGNVYKVRFRKCFI